MLPVVLSKYRDGCLRVADPVTISQEKDTSLGKMQSRQRIQRDVDHVVV